MKKLNNILFSLIGSVVTEQSAGCAGQNASAEALDEKTLEAVFALAKRHDLAHLLARGVRGAKSEAENPECTDPSGDTRGVSDSIGRISKELSSELERAELTAVWRARNTLNEQERVRKLLENAKIPFILLKGAVVRDYYAEAWMRTSSDIDILVHSDAIPEVVKCLLEAGGYKVDQALADTAAFYAASGVRIEVLTDFEGDGEDRQMLDAAWRRADTCGSYEHFLSAEDYYFYHVAHMAKHMKQGGCGIRPFIDLYLINSHSDPDRDQLADMLGAHGLDRFENAAVKLSEAWMSGGDAQGLEAFESYVLTGGVYGSVDQYVAAGIGNGRSKLGYLFYRLFMPYHELKKRHGALDGRPWLTPVFWVWRWCGLIVPWRFKRSRRELASTVKLDESQGAGVAELFESLGL